MLAASEATIEQLRRRVVDATKPLPTINLSIDSHQFPNSHSIRKELWEGLKRAAELAPEYPMASVAESRQVLEAAVNMLWMAAGNERNTSRRVTDLLAELRGHPLLPDPDWHLVKNLYSRASAIIHDEVRGRADLALWIFFGAVQFCELVPGKT